MKRRLLFELQYLLGSAPWDTGQSPPELLSYLRDTAPGKALDLGCGTGTNVVTMAKHGWDAVGVDHASLAIWMARRRARHAGVDAEFHRADVSRFESDHAPFDLVLDIGCFHSLSEPAQMRYAANLRQLLRPGGTYLLYTWLSKNGEEARAPSEGEIRGRFSLLCQLDQLARGQDRAGGTDSAWFTFRRPAR
jgi:cyclopropane fatty-acyl-phospholipid synthase-like methyltransferase